MPASHAGFQDCRTPRHLGFGSKYFTAARLLRKKWSECITATNWGIQWQVGERTWMLDCCVCQIYNLSMMMWPWAWVPKNALSPYKAISHEKPCRKLEDLTLGPSNEFLKQLSYSQNHSLLTGSRLRRMDSLSLVHNCVPLFGRSWRPWPARWQKTAQFRLTRAWWV